MFNFPIFRSLFGTSESIGVVNTVEVLTFLVS